MQECTAIYEPKYKRSLFLPYNGKSFMLPISHCTSLVVLCTTTRTLNRWSCSQFPWVSKWRRFAGHLFSCTWLALGLQEFQRDCYQASNRKKMEQTHRLKEKTQTRHLHQLIIQLIGEVDRSTPSIWLPRPSDSGVWRSIFALNWRVTMATCKLSAIQYSNAVHRTDLLSSQIQC